MPIKVDLNPEAIVAEPTGSVAGDDIQARRQALFERFERDQSVAPKIDLTEATKEQEPPREPIDFLLLQTPVGEIEFGPPPNVSLTMRIATMMGESNGNRVTNAMMRTLMCVRKINGSAVTPITSMVEAQYLANQLTDGVVDFLYGILTEYWPPPRPQDLQVIRKSLRIT